MMFGLEKGAITHRNKEKRAIFTRFSNVQSGAHILRAKENFNCLCEDGELRRGIGLVRYKKGNGEDLTTNLISSVVGAFFSYENDGTGGNDTASLYFTIWAGYIYRADMDAGTTSRKVISGKYTKHAVLRDETKKIYNVFGGEKAVVVSSDGTTFTRVLTGTLKGFCAVGGRCFAANGDLKIVYTPPYAPSEFGGVSENGGELYLPTQFGKIVGLTGLGEYVYIFLQRAIFRLKASAEEKTFQLERVHYEGGHILNRAMQTFENAVYFLSTAGIYKLSGKETEKICPQWDLRDAVEEYVCTVGRCGNILLFEYQEADGAGTTAVKRIALCLDTADVLITDSYGTLGGSEYCSEGGTVYCFSKNSAVADYRNDCYFQTQTLDFGSTARKRLQKLLLKGRGEVEVRVVAGEQDDSYTLNLQDGEASVRLYQTDKSFTFTFYPKGGASVESVTIDYTQMEE